MGIRTCQTIFSAVGSQCLAKWKMPVPFNRIWAIVPTGIAMVPKLTARNMEASSSTPKINTASGVGNKRLTVILSWCLSCALGVASFIRALSSGRCCDTSVTSRYHLPQAYRCQPHQQVQYLDYPVSRTSEQRPQGQYRENTQSHVDKHQAGRVASPE